MSVKILAGFIFMAFWLAGCAVGGGASQNESCAFICIAKSTEVDVASGGTGAVSIDAGDTR